MKLETILFTKQDHIAIIKLNRPDRLNALNDQVIEEFVSVIDEVDRDEDCRVVVVTGVGKAFSAGADMKKDEGGESLVHMEPNPELIRQAIRKGPPRATRRLKALEIPSIAAINGVAVGAGLDIALACDLRVGCETTRCRFAFTGLGTVAGSGGWWCLPRIVGLPKAMELIFTNRWVEGQEAEKIGLVNKLVSSAELEKEALALAQLIAEQPPITIKIHKLLLREALAANFPSAMEITAGMHNIGLMSEDFREAINAFRDKRKPLFKGR